MRETSSVEAGSAGTSDVRFRVVEKDELGHADLTRMLELLVAAFGRWPTVDDRVAAADHLRWKTSSPAAVCAATLGEAGDTLVTTDTAMAYPLLIRGRVGLRVQFVDHAVRAEFRGRGLSSASIAFRQRAVAPRYDLSISDAQSPTMIHRAVKFGTQRFGNEVHPLVLPLRRRDFARHWARSQGLPRWLARPVALSLDVRHAARSRRPAAPTPRSIAIAAVERFDPGIDDFFAVAGEPWDLIVARTRAHLDWRYCDPRAGSFRKLLATDASGAVLGYAIGAARGERGLVADLLTLPDRDEVASALIAALVADLERAGCVEALCWLTQRHPYRDAFRRAGFLEARETPSITFRIGRGEPAELDFLTTPEARIHFTLGDTDLV